MIKQAIIPLAGLGTRLLPLTSVMPKELLPINGKPGLEYILDECLKAGIKEVIFIISNKKKIIKDYFYKDAFFKKIINKKKNNKELKAQYAKIKKFKKMIKFVYQNKPKGTGDAVLKCKPLIKSKFFLMLLPDDLIVERNCSLDMIKLHKKYNASVIASKRVKNKDVSRLLCAGAEPTEFNLGISCDFMQNVIAQVGNFGEIYARTIEPIGLAREGSLNASWKNGGLIYAPPMR